MSLGGSADIFTFVQPIWFPRKVYAVNIVLIVFFGIIGVVLALKHSNTTKSMRYFIAASMSSGTLVISAVPLVT